MGGVSVNDGYQRPDLRARSDDLSWQNSSADEDEDNLIKKKGIKIYINGVWSDTVHVWHTIQWHCVVSQGVGPCPNRFGECDHCRNTHRTDTMSNTQQDSHRSITGKGLLELVLNCWDALREGKDIVRVQLCLEHLESLQILRPVRRRKVGGTALPG